MHHKNCAIDIIKKLRKTPIRKNIIISAVVAANVRDNAAMVDTSVPIAPAIKHFPYMHMHRFNDGKIFVLERGISVNNDNKEITDRPNAIHNAIIAFVKRPKLNITATPIPTITLIIKAVPQLQEFCLHIIIVLSIKFG